MGQEGLCTPMHSSWHCSDGIPTADGSQPLPQQLLDGNHQHFLERPMQQRQLLQSAACWWFLQLCLHPFVPCPTSQIIFIPPLPLSLTSLFICTTAILFCSPPSSSLTNALRFQMLIICTTKRLRSGSRLFDLWPVIYFHLPAFKCYFGFTLTY